MFFWIKYSRLPINTWSGRTLSHFCTGSELASIWPSKFCWGDYNPILAVSWRFWHPQAHYLRMACHSRQGDCSLMLADPDLWRSAEFGASCKTTFGMSLASALRPSHFSWSWQFWQPEWRHQFWLIAQQVVPNTSISMHVGNTWFDDTGVCLFWLLIFGRWNKAGWKIVLNI